jgi:antitoxin component YwqK of YwqJK toxin-antitoxin module
VFESGWGDLGYDHESVFDPTQEVHEDSYLDVVMKREYTSFTFIGLLQKKIEEYKNEEEGEYFEDFLGWLGICGGHGGVDDLCSGIGCTDYKITLEKEDDSFLWFSHYELSTEHQNIWVEEINVKDLKNGPSKEYYENGKLKSEGDFKKGRKEGSWKFYDKDGQIECEVSYKEDKKYEGVWKLYNEDGFYLQESYKEGKREGLWKIHYRQYQSVVEHNVYKQEGNYKNDEKNGIWKFYDENNNLVGEVYFEDGKKNGVFKEYNKHGRLRKEGSYKGDKKKGSWKFYDKDGQIECELLYKEGEKFKGINKEFDTSGYLETEEIWEDGYVVERKRFNEKGNINYHGYFKEGQLIKGGWV